jgi:hypothetical protein
MLQSKRQDMCGQAILGQESHILWVIENLVHVLARPR